jgi:cytochrome c biogenesis protein CcmG, thiol:disulfide interchange protein DsbE
MPKPTHSQTSTRNSATAPGAKGRPEAQRKQIPQARRGSGTKPVKKGPPWMPIAISGGLVALAAIFVVVLVATRSPSSNQTVTQRPAPVASPVPGTPAPDFKVTAKDGSVLSKADVVGKPTMMIFFASWCPHCNNEAPLLKDLATKNPDVNFVAIGVFDRETADDIYKFQTTHNLPFPTYSDGGKAASAYGIYSYPTLMAVDKTGTIKDVQTGEKTADQLNAMLAKAKG